MYKYFYKYIFFFLVLLIFQSCSDSPTDAGLDLLDNQKVTVVLFDSAVDSINQNSQSFLKRINTGLADRLLLGQVSETKSSILIEFNIAFDESTRNLIKSNDVQVVSNRIIFKKNYSYGDTSVVFQTSNINGYRINSEWAPDKVRLDSLPSIDKSLDILTLKPTPDSLYYFGVSNTVVLDWVKNAADTSLAKNYGIFLEPQANTSYIIGFQGYSNTLQTAPQIEITLRFLTTGRDSTLIFNSISDAHVIEGYYDKQPDLLAVRSGIAINTKLYFDLSKIPADALINYAELTLVNDSTKTVIGSSGFNSIITSVISSAVSDTVLTDYVSPTGSLIFSNGRYYGNVTSVITRIIREKNNLGILLKPGLEIEGLETIYFKSSNAILSERPQLKITYSRLK